MKKLNVNTDLCMGCGACVNIDPEHFDFDDKGYSTVINNDNLESDDLKNAVSSCPANAIKLEETLEHTCNCGDDCQCDDDCHCDGTCSCHKE